MGSKSTKPRSELKKFDVEVVCDKIYQHLLINRDRKINELATRERELRDAMKAGRKSYEDVLLEMIAIVNLFKYIKASKMILRYCLILKDHSLQICDASRSKNMAGIWELETYFQGLIWSADKLNLTYIKEFNKLVYTHFGPEIFKEMQFFTKVDKELRQCFSAIEPSPNEIKEYLEKFCSRYEINDFDFGGRKQGFQPGGGQQDKKAVEDLDAMLNNIKNQGGFGQTNNNNNAINDHQSYALPNVNANPGMQTFDPTQPQNVPNMYQQPYTGPDARHYGYDPTQHMEKPSPYPQQHFDFVGQNQDYPALTPPRSDPGNNYPKADEMNAVIGLGDSCNLTDDQIKAAIDNNIKKSQGGGSNPVPANTYDRQETPKLEANLDELIARLKELGVTAPEQKVSEIHYSAQKHYQNSKHNINDYKIDFDDHSPKPSK